MLILRNKIKLLEAKNNFFTNSISVFPVFHSTFSRLQNTLVFMRRLIQIEFHFWRLHKPVTGKSKTQATRNYGMVFRLKKLCAKVILCNMCRRKRGGTKRRIYLITGIWVEPNMYWQNSCHNSEISPDVGNVQKSRVLKHGRRLAGSCGTSRQSNRASA